jgi:hypothetical protein
MTLSPQQILNYLMLIAGNSVALLGVLTWGWHVHDILYLYWAENLVIGVLTLVRLLVHGSRMGATVMFGALFAAGFFIVHYGIFMLGHGAIIVDIFFPEDIVGAGVGEFEALFAMPFLLDIQGFWFAMAGVVLADCVIAARDVARDRNRTLELKGLHMIMAAPYGRIVVLHITIIVGALLMQATGADSMFLVVFVVMKIMYDLGIITLSDLKREKEDNAVLGG